MATPLYQVGPVPATPLFTKRTKEQLMEMERGPIQSFYTDVMSRVFGAGPKAGQLPATMQDVQQQSGEWWPTHLSEQERFFDIMQKQAAWQANYTNMVNQQIANAQRQAMSQPWTGGILPSILRALAAQFGIPMF